MNNTFLTAAIVIFLTASAAIADELAVIVRQGINETVTEKMLEKIYLKRKTMWDDGRKIVPVNLPSENESRKIFTESILRQSHRELVEYWNEAYFKGITPPVVLESEEAVKIFVRQVDGAIGYIRKESVDTDLRIIYLIKK